LDDAAVDLLLFASNITALGDGADDTSGFVVISRNSFIAFRSALMSLLSCSSKSSAIMSTNPNTGRKATNNTIDISNLLPAGM
jgi:hypothetical protein